MSFLDFLGTKAAAGIPGLPKLPTAATKPVTSPNLPPGGAPPPITGSRNPLQRMNEFSWLTGMSQQRPAHLGAAPPTPAAAGSSGPAGSWGSSAYGLAEMAGAVPSTNPVGMGAMFGPSSALGWGVPWAAKKIAPGWTSQLSARLGGTAAGKFLNSSGAGGNAFNLARSLSPWAAGGTAPVNAFAPGAVLGGAPGAGAIGGTGTAGTVGTAGTAAGALYGAYALGDVPVAGYQLATGEWNPRERTNEQLARMHGNGVLGNTGGYLSNVGQNLLRPGKAYLNSMSDGWGTLKDLGHFARRTVTGSRF